MPLLHQTRQFVNKLLSPVGFALVRVEKQPWSRPKIVTLTIGRYSIQVPAINPLSTLYVRNPGYTGHLGRLAALLKTKYPGLVAIDIGANVGDTACIIRSAADVPMLCIEGDDFSFGFLERNLRQFQNVTAHKLFLGEKTQALAANIEKGGWNTTLTPDAGGSAHSVQIVSLDDFLAARTDTSAMKLVKIDTEGFDCSIIRGAGKFIAQAHPVISFEYNRDNMAALGEKGLDTLALLSSLGYSQAAYHDCDGRFFSSATLSNDGFIRDLHDYADGKHGAIYYFDLTVFHRDDDAAAGQFIEAERARRLNQ
jgi:FkbM family methyltransferase